jgi:hypothetical protein
VSKIEPADEFFLERIGRTVRDVECIDLILARDAAQFRAGALAALDDILRMEQPSKGGYRAQERASSTAIRLRILAGTWPKEQP